jgi:hypothetical protein
MYAIYLDEKIQCWIMQERNINHILLYLACEQTMFEVRQLQRKNVVRQLKREWCMRIRQPMNKLCMGVNISNLELGTSL